MRDLEPRLSLRESLKQRVARFHLAGQHDQKTHGGHGGFSTRTHASEAEFKFWQGYTAAKIAKAPVPDAAEVARARRDLEIAGRAGGESRGGSASARRQQRLSLFKEYGGDKKGYVVDPWTGLKMHWTQDPEQNPKGYPLFERGKIFTKYQGGGYQLPNLIPESFEANRARGSKPLRPENLI